MKNLGTPKNETLEMFDVALPAEANLQLADSVLVNYYQARKNRIIYLTKDIDETLWEEIQLILQWNREDNENGIAPEERKPIKILIHSFGGNLNETLAICGVMKLSKTPIYTINMNCALSGGCLILMNGHKGHRYAMPMSTALIHMGSRSGGGGTFSQIVEETDNYKKLINMLKENIIEHSTISAQTLTKNAKKEWYLYPEDQVKYGLVDKLVENIDELL